jgi:hypothetical protein
MIEAELEVCEVQVAEPPTLGLIPELNPKRAVKHSHAAGAFERVHLRRPARTGNVAYRCYARMSGQ